MFEANCNGAIFERYIKKVLVPELQQDQIVVMDNVNFHKKDEVQKAIENAGCKVLYLPTYSPDLNPIEHCWFKIKNSIQKIKNNFEDFWDTVFQTLSAA